jgi:hypothetical protein
VKHVGNDKNKNVQSVSIINYKHMYITKAGNFTRCNCGYFLLFLCLAVIHMKIVAFVSGKGGVGKTTLGFLLGLALQRAERRVNFLDLDPQASLTSLIELHNIKRDDGATAEFLIARYASASGI